MIDLMNKSRKLEFRREAEKGRKKKLRTLFKNRFVVGEEAFFLSKAL